jgi:hypothetical protein
VLLDATAIGSAASGSVVVDHASAPN